MDELYNIGGVKMDDNIIKNKEEFINKYIKLCMEYKLMVDSCGCCQSPWLSICRTPKDIKFHKEHLMRMKI